MNGNHNLVCSVAFLSSRADLFVFKLLPIPMPGSLPNKIRVCDPVTNPPSLGAQNCAQPEEDIKQGDDEDANGMWLVI